MGRGIRRFKPLALGLTASVNLATGRSLSLMLSYASTPGATAMVARRPGRAGSLDRRWYGDGEQRAVSSVRADVCGEVAALLLREV